MFWYQSKTKEKVVRIDIATVNETKVFISKKTTKTKSLETEAKAILSNVND